MTVSTRILTSLVFLAVGLAGVGAVQQGWVNAAGMGPQAGPADARSRQMAARFAVIGQRIKEKTRIGDRLNAGEMSLFEAASWFGYRNRTPADCQDVRWRDMAGRCNGEKLCRQVICWMGPLLRSKG